METHVFRIDGEVVWNSGESQTEALVEIAELSDEPIRSVTYLGTRDNVRWDYSGDGVGVTAISTPA